MEAARRQAMEAGISLKDFFIAALEQKMAKPQETRLEPPSIDGPEEMTHLSREQTDEAMFG